MYKLFPHHNRVELLQFERFVGSQPYSAFSVYWIMIVAVVVIKNCLILIVYWIMIMALVLIENSLIFII